MEFLIADTFTDSLARLNGEEQKAVKTTTFDLQLNLANPGMNFHKLDRAKDKQFWSIRVNKDLRIIVHRSERSLLICYVNHHDKAYDWAERRKLEVHPKTGAAQLIEIRETVREVIIPKYIVSEIITEPKPKLFSDYSVDDLLAFGVPEEWLNDVLDATEDTLLSIAEHLPTEAAEGLLEIATGGKAQISKVITKEEDPFKHPDAGRRFRILTTAEELERALEFPWDKWAVFLHPVQREIAEGSYSGPVRVYGSAGTGKSIVALHRAVFLARQNPESRILLTTYSGILANALKVKLRRLISNEPRLIERIDVYSIDEIGLKLFKSNIGKPNVITTEHLRNLILAASSKFEDLKFSQAFLFSEYQLVFDAWHIEYWEEYKNVKRLGRKTRLPEEQRMVLWYIFNAVNEQLQQQGLLTTAALFTLLARHIETTAKQPYDFAVIDESQDMGVYHLRFLAALGKHRPNGLFFTGDLGQRIFQQLFSWRALGIDIRGRSKTLKVNYRTSDQIRKKADLLLAPEVIDADGNIESRDSTISVINGSVPEIKIFGSIEDESQYVADWVMRLKEQDIALHEISLFVRSNNEIGRAIRAANLAGVKYILLDESMESLSNSMVISTMHLAKGLEFRAVSVMACDDEVIPSQERIETITDNADLEDVYNTERQLLYVACTRARDQLLISGVSPASEFLGDFANVEKI